MEISIGDQSAKTSTKSEWIDFVVHKEEQNRGIKARQQSNNDCYQVESEKCLTVLLDGSKMQFSSTVFNLHSYPNEDRIILQGNIWTFHRFSLNVIWMSNFDDFSLWKCDPIWFLRTIERHGTGIALHDQWIKSIHSDCKQSILIFREFQNLDMCKMVSARISVKALSFIKNKLN